MADESEEIMMLHYLLYKALADERTRELVAAARRHELTAAATHNSRDTTERASRLADVTARMAAVLSGRRGARARSRVTSVSGAGPIGCAT